MATNFNPFLVYSNQLQALLVKASTQKNPALWLYQNNARTPLFMLEALMRLHSKAFEEKLFIKWLKRFKALEDELGALDYFVAYENEFKINKKISKDIKSYFTQQAHVIEDRLNIRLHSKKWFEGKLLKFNVKISEYSVLDNKEYIDDLKKVIEKEVTSIKDFALKCNYSFSQLEEEVHEIRRKLRWISIYAQALNGLIQLKPSAKKPKYAIDYLTKDILKSPFNTLPKKPQTNVVVEFDSNSFYALSWMIKEIGMLKDNGLRVEALTQAIKSVEKTTYAVAEKKALLLLNEKNDVEARILKYASEIVFSFITKDKVLDGLIIKK